MHESFDVVSCALFWGHVPAIKYKPTNEKELSFSRRVFKMAAEGEELCDIDEPFEWSNTTTKILLDFYKKH